MTTTMTTKQAEYRMALQERRLIDEVRKYTTKRAGQREQHLATFALIDALPTPATAAEASEQIDALQPTYMALYVKRHQDWAQPILNRLLTAWGPHAEQWPVAQPMPLYGRGVHPDGRVEMIACGEEVTVESLRNLLATAR